MPNGVKAPVNGREMRKLLQRAQKGDESCLPQVKALLSDPNVGPGICDHGGSPAIWLQYTLSEKCAGSNTLLREAIGRKLDKVRTDLEGPSPTPIERLLAERATLCWFMANWYEESFQRTNCVSIKQAEYLQRRIDRAHRRFLTSVETLARVRKLAVPILQVNLANNQQINTSGTPK